MCKHPSEKLVIGLTGGIGSGKSTVARLFTQLGIDIIDADQITRELVKLDSLLLEKIVNKFGDEILSPNRTLNRKTLSEKIFRDKKARIWLEDLLHPLVYQEMLNRINKIKSPYCVLVILAIIPSYDLQPNVGEKVY